MINITTARNAREREREWVKNATETKSKQMFNSLKRTAKIPPNGLIKWQAFFQQGKNKNLIYFSFLAFFSSCSKITCRRLNSQCNKIIYVRKCCLRFKQARHWCGLMHLIAYAGSSGLTDTETSNDTRARRNDLILNLWLPAKASCKQGDNLNALKRIPVEGLLTKIKKTFFISKTDFDSYGFLLRLIIPVLNKTSSLCINSLKCVADCNVFSSLRWTSNWYCTLVSRKTVSHLLKMLFHVNDTLKTFKNHLNRCSTRELRHLG